MTCGRVAPEVVLHGAGRNHQVVIRRNRGFPEQVGGNSPHGEVDAGEIAAQNASVGLSAQHLAGRRRNLSLGGNAGGHLIEQRLEQVVCRPRHERQIDRRPLQRLGRKQSTESAAHDNDVWPCGSDVHRVPS
jgi:hypothetical protein